jgi:hypothetical protein
MQLASKHTQLPIIQNGVGKSVVLKKQDIILKLMVNTLKMFVSQLREV